MTTVFINGRVAVSITYFQQQRHITEAGARVDIRRASEVAGPADRTGAEGFTVHPVGGGGGIWRADLLVVLDDGSGCFHYHPEFKDDDVGERVLDPLLDEEPRTWIESQLRNLPKILENSGAADLIPSLDMGEHLRSLPLMMNAIDNALARIPIAAAGLQRR